MNDQCRTYACSNDDTTIIYYVEANKINMVIASYVLADLSGHCEGELFIYFVVMAESDGPGVTLPCMKPKRQSHFD